MSSLITPIHVAATRNPGVFMERRWGCDIKELSFAEVHQMVLDRLDGRKSEVRRGIAELRYRRQRLIDAHGHPAPYMRDAMVESAKSSMRRARDILQNRWREYREAQITARAWNDAAMIRRTEGWED